jgi:hypothetical protein
MDATLVLADYAAAENGKLTVVGGGWTVCGPNPMPHALGMIVEVGWDEANQPHEMEVRLVDTDGQPVVDAANQPIATLLRFEAGRPSGHPIGAPLSNAMAMIVPPLPLTPGGRYEWQLIVDGESRPAWRRPFSVRRASLQRAS